jgi:hypothetical protein
MPSLPQFNPTRIRSYVFRLPLTTRLLLAAIVGLWAVAIPLPWVREVSALTPDKFDLTQSTLLSVCLGFGAWRQEKKLDVAESGGCAHRSCGAQGRCQELGVCQL